MTGIGITGWGTAIPERRLTNAELEQMVDTNDQWIVERSGIRERRVAAPGEPTSALATEACADALKRAGLTPADIDLLIVATVTPDNQIPHTGAWVGEALGLQCGSFDINAACSGFVYELVVGSAMLRMGMRNVLIVGAETLSNIIDYQDRATCILFGDAAGAAVLTAGTARDTLLAWDLGCDGSAAELLIIPAGGSRRPASAETVAARGHYLKMQGGEVFKRAVRAVVDSARITLDRAGADAAEVDWFVPHQANIRIIESAATRLGIPKERTLVNLERFGNTSSASIPVALFEAVEDGRVQPGDKVLLSGFGAGMTWASALLQWGTE